VILVAVEFAQHHEAVSGRFSYVKFSVIPWAGFSGTPYGVSQLMM